MRVSLRGVVAKLRSEGGAGLGELGLDAPREEPRVAKPTSQIPRVGPVGRPPVAERARSPRPLSAQRVRSPRPQSAQRARSPELHVGRAPVAERARTPDAPARTPGRVP